MDVVPWLISVAVVSLVIHKACAPFSDAAHFLGRNLPGSIRGATLDAVASSAPELFTTLLFLFLYGEFESGVATCAGSAVYNMMVIPAICALAIGRVEVPKDVIWRDGVCFVLCEVVLIIILFSGNATWWMGLTLVAMYGAYLAWLRRDADRKSNCDRRGDREQRGSRQLTYAGELSVLENKYTTARAWVVVIVTTMVIGASCYVLVRSVLAVAVALNVAPYFVAVILAAGATSVPDTFLSVNSARMGDHGGAIANALGSNIFDINIVLGLPILIYTVQMGDSLSFQRTVLEVPLLLLALSVATLALMAHRYVVTVKKARFLLGFYVLFVVYAVVRGVAFPPGLVAVPPDGAGTAATTITEPDEVAHRAIPPSYVGQGWGIGNPGTRAVTCLPTGDYVPGGAVLGVSLGGPSQSWR